MMQTKGLKIIRNVSTKHLSMLSPLKKGVEYHALVNKMHQNGLDAIATSTAREVATTNHNLLVGIFVPIALVGFFFYHCLKWFNAL